MITAERFLFEVEKTRFIERYAVLREAACKLSRDPARIYGRGTLHGDHVIRLKGPYDIAIRRQPDGNYGLTTDWRDGQDRP